MLNLFLSGEGGFQTNKKENRSKKNLQHCFWTPFFWKGGGVNKWGV